MINIMEFHSNRQELQGRIKELEPPGLIGCLLSQRTWKTGYLKLSRFEMTRFEMTHFKVEG